MYCAVAFSVKICSAVEFACTDGNFSCSWQVTYQNAVTSSEQSLGQKSSPTNACSQYVEENGLAAMLAAKRLAGVVPEVISGNM